MDLAQEVKNQNGEEKEVTEKTVWNHFGGLRISVYDISDRTAL